MKRMRRGSSLLAAAALFLALFQPMPASAASLYFTAVNDSVAPLTSNSMPFWSGGMLYVPYTVFDASLNGINVGLGLYTSYNRESQTISLFNLRQMLIFDLTDGTCWDNTTETTYSSRAILRNGRPYLSLNMVCSFFGLEYSYNQLPYISQGYLVRIKSADAVIDDTSFIDAARNVINNRLRDYTQNLSSADVTSPGTSQGNNPGTSPSTNPGTSPSTSPGTNPSTNSGTSPSTNPSTNPGGNSGSSPGTNPGTSPSVTPGTPSVNPGVNPGNTNSSAPGTKPEPDDTETYLAFCCESAGGLASILNTLDGQRSCVVFFLPPQLLEEEGDLVRRALGTGHSVGILADSGEEDLETLLARGSEAVEAAAHTRTTLAYVPPSQRAALEEAGWVCWRETALLRPDGPTGANTYASNAVKRLGNRNGAVYLTLKGEENAARVLPALLRSLSDSSYIVSIPLETRL